MRITATRSTALVAASITALIAMVGCSGVGDGGTVAKAGKIEVSARDVRAIVDAVPEPSRAVLLRDKAVLERVVRAELARRLLLEQARGAHLDADAKVQPELDRVRDDALVRLWIAKQGTVSKDYPGVDEVNLAYQSNQAALTTPASYQVAQIFVSAPNGIAPDQLALAMRKAADVGSRIPGGDFAALAREYSEHAESAAKGGDVGMLPENRMLPEIVGAVRNLPAGATVGPIKTSQGLHYLKLLARKDGEALTLEQARPQLVEALRARRAQELQQAYLAQLDSKLGVSVDQIALAALAGKAPTENR